MLEGGGKTHIEKNDTTSCAKLANNIGSLPKENPKMMMLRGTSGVLRYLDNENEMSGYVESQGFDIIDPMKCTIVELARRAFNADDVVGVEGSNLYHALFAMNKKVLY